MHSTRNSNPLPEPRVHKTTLSDGLSARYRKLPLLMIGDAPLAKLNTLRPPSRPYARFFNVLYSLSIPRINEGSQVITFSTLSICVYITFISWCLLCLSDFLSQLILPHWPTTSA